MSGTEDTATAVPVACAIRWMWLFLDQPAETAAAAETFWAAATRSTLSQRRGDAGEFRTLEPATGDPAVRLQRIGHDTGAGTAGLHLDLDVDDPRAAATRAVIRFGAEVIAEHWDEGFAVLRSPGGFVFCFTDAADGPSGRAEPTAHRVREGEPDLLDQVCLDIPSDRWNAEVAFWSDLTGWPARAAVRDEFAYLKSPKDGPLRILLQRTDSPAARVTAHPDIACTDREATVARLVDLGAHIVVRMPWWTVLRDPTGRPFCVIARDPVTGRIG